MLPVEENIAIDPHVKGQRLRWGGSEKTYKLNSVALRIAFISQDTWERLKWRMSRIPWGRPCGRVVGFTSSALAAQGFAGSDPGRGHGTAHEAMLRWRPTWHSQRDLQLEYTTVYWGALGRRRREKKKILSF